jgi:hypothetical protein
MQNRLPDPYRRRIEGIPGDNRDPMLIPTALALLVAAVLAIVAGAIEVRRSGARTAVARRLAGARQVAVGELDDLPGDPVRPVRVAGRIRCPNPIRTQHDEQLVALHRDVEVLTAAAGWRPIERIRESRGFELWDHAGAVTIDAADAAEPLITIPYVWQGSPAELDDNYRGAVDRLAAEHGGVRAARATTRTISTIDRLLVLGEVERDEVGRALLAPPRGGYLISSLELPDAMRLLAGPGRRQLLFGAALVAGGLALALAGIVLLALGLAIG